MSDNQREAGTIILDPTHASFAPEETVHDLGATHFIGIGGAGMSVLAEMLHEQGVEVDGSDREPSAKTDRLQSLGITVEFGQQAKNVEGKNTVVFSSAIKPWDYMHDEDADIFWAVAKRSAAYRQVLREACLRKSAALARLRAALDEAA